MLVHLCQTELMISHEKQAQIQFLGFSLSILNIRELRVWVRVSILDCCC